MCHESLLIEESELVCPLTLYDKVFFKVSLDIYFENSFEDYLIATFYNNIYSCTSFLCTCLEKKSLKIQVDFHLCLFWARCTYSAGIRDIDGILCDFFYLVLIYYYTEGERERTNETFKILNM